MNCNHMYLTDADKELNMCGLCGVTFDEWREGKVSTFKDGVMAERERITKLLEEHQPSELGQELGIYPCTCGYDSPDIDLTQHHMALIKGEK